MDNLVCFTVEVDVGSRASQQSCKLQDLSDLVHHACSCLQRLQRLTIKTVASSSLLMLKQPIGNHPLLYTRIAQDLSRLEDLKVFTWVYENHGMEFARLLGLQDDLSLRQYVFDVGAMPVNSKELIIKGLLCCSLTWPYEDTPSKEYKSALHQAKLVQGLFKAYMSWSESRSVVDGEAIMPSTRVGSFLVADEKMEMREVVAWKHEFFPIWSEWKPHVLKMKMCYPESLKGTDKERAGIPGEDGDSVTDGDTDVDVTGAMSDAS